MSLSDDKNLVIEVATVNSVRLIQVSYPTDYFFLPEQVPELKQCLFLDKFSSSKGITERWVYQPFWGKFDLQYAISEIFTWLETQESLTRHKFGYRGFLTASAFVKDKQVICWGIQDVSKHILTVPTDPKWWQQLQALFKLTSDQLEDLKVKLADRLPSSGLDVREVLKQFLPIPSGTAYELNPGSHEDNHSEALTLYQFFGVSSEAELDEAMADSNNQEKLNLLRGSTCYLHGHWWSCADCGRKMAKVGVKAIIINQQWVCNYLDTKQPMSASALT